MMNFEPEVWEEGVKESMKNERPEAAVRRWGGAGGVAGDRSLQRPTDTGAKCGWRGVGNNTTICQLSNCAAAWSL